MLRVPLSGLVNVITEVTSMFASGSVSLASTLMVAGVSSSVVVLSSIASGGAFTGVGVFVGVCVAVGSGCGSGVSVGGGGIGVNVAVGVGVLDDNGVAVGVTVAVAGGVAVGRPEVAVGVGVLGGVPVGVSRLAVAVGVGEATPMSVAVAVGKGGLGEAGTTPGDAAGEAVMVGVGLATVRDGARVDVDEAVGVGGRKTMAAGVSATDARGVAYSRAISVAAPAPRLGSSGAKRA
jgi:hypothetical protein